MGIYLKLEEPEAWWRKNVRHATAAQALFPDKADVPVIALPNPWGLSIAVGFSQRETRRFIEGRADASFGFALRAAVAAALPAEVARELGYG